MSKPLVNPGDTIFFVRKDLQSWDGGKLIYKSKVLKLEISSYHEDRILCVNGQYVHEWFLSKEDAKARVIQYIEAEESHLAAMRSQIES